MSAGLPIPTYEEAIASLPSSRLGAAEISDDAERQGLLREPFTQGLPPSSRRGNYEPPHVESARPSVDSLDGLDHESDDGLRREIQQMEVDDTQTTSNRTLLGYQLSKRFNSFTHSFSSLQIPSFRTYFRTFSMPRPDLTQIGDNRVVILGRLFGLFLIVGVMWLLIATDVISFHRNRSLLNQMYDPAAIRIFVQDHMNMHGNIQESLKHITQFPHIAGTEGGFILAEWLAEEFRAGELDDVELERFDVYLNYPRKDGRRIAITKPEDRRWEAHIEEMREETLVFHGHSKSGEVTGPLVYANFGSDEDFQTLKDQGISVKGAIVLARYYGTQGDRAMKVKSAELAGAIGCILYSDPSQDGSARGPTFPEGRYMPGDGVQRGTVAMTSWVVGDVLSPGWPALPDKGHRLKPSESHALNKIPSLPVSWNDAQNLLDALKTRGKDMTKTWAGTPETEYWTGDGKLPEVDLKNLQDEETYQPIYNVVGQMPGWESDSRIIIGNHHDAWCFGAADPGIGTAIMLEVVRVFGDLRRIGWRPMRTIQFASWDAEEYNLIGSTEHVEARLDDLRENAYAYINLDMNTGSQLHVGASPIFERPLSRVLNRITDPATNLTLSEVWQASNKSITGLGAGSDHVAFQDIAGTSSIDLSFVGSTYPYHSCYDNFEWMSRFGDDNWSYSKAMGEIIALLILELADEPLLPFAMENYARAVHRYVDNLQDHIDSIVSSFASTLDRPNPPIDLTPLRTVTSHFLTVSRKFDAWSAEWSRFILQTQGFETAAMLAKRTRHNEAMSQFEVALLDLGEFEDQHRSGTKTEQARAERTFSAFSGPLTAAADVSNKDKADDFGYQGSPGGLPGRRQFKHVIFAPSLYSGYDEAFFPGIRDAVDARDWEGARRQIEKVSWVLSRAVGVLEGEVEED